MAQRKARRDQTRRSSRYVHQRNEAPPKGTRTRKSQRRKGALAFDFAFAHSHFQRSSRIGRCTSLRTTTSQLPPVSHRPHRALQLSFTPSRSCTSFLHRPKNSPSLRVRAPALPAVPSLAGSSHGEKAPPLTAPTHSPNRSHQRPTGPTSTPSSALSPMTKKAPPPPPACNAPSRPLPSSHSVSPSSPNGCAASPKPSKNATLTRSLPSR